MFYWRFVRSSPVPSSRSFFRSRAASTLPSGCCCPCWALESVSICLSPPSGRRRGGRSVAELRSLLPFPAAAAGNFRGVRSGWRWNSRVAGNRIPVLIPMFGSAGGGLFGFLILMTIAGVLVTPARRWGRRRCGALPSRQLGAAYVTKADGPVAGPVAGWLAGQCRELQQESARPGRNGQPPPTAPACRRCCRETCLALMRQAQLLGHCQLRSGARCFR